MKITVQLCLAAAVFLAACSGSENNVPPEAPPVAKKDSVITPPPTARVFTYNERYFIENASIADAKDIDDALQAIRVIQLKEGKNQVIVISSFDKLGETSLETWFGIEMPSFAPGTYNLADAVQAAFYRFYLGDERKRIDGQVYEGTITVDSNDDEAVTGYIDATINGQTRSFEEESKDVRVRFTGSFRIGKVDLENTMMKTR